MQSRHKPDVSNQTLETSIEFPKCLRHFFNGTIGSSDCGTSGVGLASPTGGDGHSCGVAGFGRGGCMGLNSFFPECQHDRRKPTIRITENRPNVLSEAIRVFLAVKSLQTVRPLWHGHLAHATRAQIRWIIQDPNSAHQCPQTCMPVAFVPRCLGHK